MLTYSQIQKALSKSNTTYTPPSSVLTLDSSEAKK